MTVVISRLGVDDPPPFPVRHPIRSEDSASSIILHAPANDLLYISIAPLQENARPRIGVRGRA
jgi:hypothetical protein